MLFRSCSSGASVLFEATAARRSAGERFHGRCGAKRRGNRGRAPRAGGRRGGMSAKTGTMLRWIPLQRARDATYTPFPRHLPRSFRRNVRISSPRARCGSELSRDRDKTRAAHDQRVGTKYLTVRRHPHSESGACRCSRGRALKGVFGKSVRFRERGPGQIFPTEIPFLH